MILLESKEYTNTIKKIVDFCKECNDNGNYTFDETIDGIQFWCDDDSDKTIFIQSELEGYATVEMNDIIESPEDCIESIKYQLTETEIDDEDDNDNPEEDSD